MARFQLGNVVALKCGSKDKVVVGIVEGGKGYNVAWEDDNGTPHAAYYPAEALELASAHRQRKRLQAERENEELRLVMDSASHHID